MPQPTSKQPVPFWLLVLITFSGTLALNLFVPALPDAARAFGVGSAAMQMTITVYILGLAGGQLVYGPLSDGLGRRRMLLVGLSLYTVAGFAAAMAMGVQSLAVARLLQALGGCAALTLGRVILISAARPDRIIRDLAALNLAMTVGSGLAPTLGSWLTLWSGWRSILLLLATLGLITVVLTWRLLPETNRPTANISFAAVSRDYLLLLRSPSFMGFTLGGGCATTSIYAFIVAAPFIFSSQLHRPLHEFGLYMGLLVVSYSSGTIMTRYLSGMVTAERLWITANLAGLACAMALLAICVFDTLTVLNLMLCMSALHFAAGVSSPVAMAKALEVDSEHLGSASGLLGFLQMGIGALTTVAVSFFVDAALGVAIILTVAMVVGQLGIWVGLRHKPGIE
jgi:MFS transporter, DHA1 family, multidrug resistance protein